MHMSFQATLTKVRQRRRITKDARNGKHIRRKTTPQIDDVFLAKEIDLRRKELIGNGYIKAVTVILADRKRIRRPFSWLYLESATA